MHFSKCPSVRCNQVLAILQDVFSISRELFSFYKSPQLVLEKGMWSAQNIWEAECVHGFRTPGILHIQVHHVPRQKLVSE